LRTFYKTHPRSYFEACLCLD